MAGCEGLDVRVPSLGCLVLRTPQSMRAFRSETEQRMWVGDRERSSWTPRTWEKSKGTVKEQDPKAWESKSKVLDTFSVGYKVAQRQLRGYVWPWWSHGLKLSSTFGMHGVVWLLAVCKAWCISLHQYAPPYCGRTYQRSTGEKVDRYIIQSISKSALYLHVFGSITCMFYL